MLRALSKIAHIDVLCGDDNHEGAGQPIGASLGVVARLPSTSVWRWSFAPFRTLPFHHASINQNAVTRSIRDIANGEPYDFLWLSKSWYCPAAFDAFQSVPVFIEQQAAEPDVWANLMANDPRWLIRMVSRINARKVERYERAVYTRVAGVVCISKRDASITESVRPGVRVIAVPIAIDCDYYVPGTDPTDPSVLLFSGRDVVRNVEAMREFLNEVFPILRAHSKSFRLLWIGDVDSDRHDFTKCDGVQVTGFVRDVPEYFRRGAIFVAPFRMGEGVKLKILEALAMGKVVVTTSVGMQGLELHGLPFVKVADSHANFARAILDFANNPMLDALSRAARTFAVREFSQTKTDALVRQFVLG